MAFNGLLITEIFHSLQGETSLAGVPFSFIRLTGCNLRCHYCDSAYAFKGGTRMSIEEVLAEVREHGTRHALLTGGEPLLQRQAVPLIRALNSEGFLTSVETHGEVSIEEASLIARIIMDIKTPSSGMSRGGYRDNLAFLKKSDEIKFVIASKEDYAWARKIVTEEKLPTEEILFSPVIASPEAPGKVPGVEAQWLAESILKDRLPVRFQMQLHKWIWGAEVTGV